MSSRRTLALLPVLGLLAACATAPVPPQVVTETDIVERERPVHVDLPADLTVPLPYPALPEGELLNRDLVDDIEAWREVVDQCNDDRARIIDLQNRSRLGRERPDG